MSFEKHLGWGQVFKNAQLQSVLIFLVEVSRASFCSAVLFIPSFNVLSFFLCFTQFGAPWKGGGWGGYSL